LLIYEPIHVVMPADHPLASRELLAPADLAQNRSLRWN
jgi:DNA-binding transcriptional LysR family regulator